MTTSPPKPVFFAKPEEFRAWLEKNHESAGELWVGYHRKASGRSSITWQQSVDEALCFGWIDGIRKKVDDSSYTNRFTPRKPTSNWSAINIARVAELTKEGRMRPAGAKAFAARSEAKSGIYAYEQRKTAQFDAALEKRFRANRNAWKFFQAQAPSYRQVLVWWVISAKQEETRMRRLEKLIGESEAGRRLR